MKALATICETLVPSIHVYSSEGVEACSAAESQESLAKSSLDDVDAFYKLSAADGGLPSEVFLFTFRSFPTWKAATLYYLHFVFKGHVMEAKVAPLAWGSQIVL